MEESFGISMALVRLAQVGADKYEQLDYPFYLAEEEKNILVGRWSQVCANAWMRTTTEVWEQGPFIFTDASGNIGF